MQEMKEAEKQPKNKELGQQIIILKEINMYLEEKISEEKQHPTIQREIHKKKELEQQKILLTKITEILSEDNNASIDETLEILSHEFRTSLVPIRAYSEMILKGFFGELNSEQREKMQVLRENVSYLDNLVSNAIDCKKMELGQIVLNKTNCDVIQLIITVLSNLDEKIRKSGTRVSFSDKSIFTSLDLKRISQVMTQIIENAIKSIQRDKKDHLYGYGRIWIKVQEEEKGILIKVVDNGAGIPEEKLPKLFSKFDKVGTINTADDPGIGLGLYLCKQIIKAHGGKIWAESSEKKGTSICFTLPKNYP